MAIKLVAHIACYNLLYYYTFNYLDLRMGISDILQSINMFQIISYKKKREYRYRYSTIVTVSRDNLDGLH